MEIKMLRRRDRVLQLINERFGGNKAAFARAIGKPAPNVHRMLSFSGEKGKDWSGIGEKIARDIEEKLGLEELWLDLPTEIGISSLFGRKVKELPERPQPTDDEFALIPQLDVVAACGIGKYVDHVVVKGGLAFKRSSLRDFGVRELAARVIYASGGSMSPTIQDGCVVLINTDDREPKEGRVYAVCTPDGSLVLKRLIKDYVPNMGGQAWIMRSDNPDKIVHPDKVLPPDDRTMLVGRAVWNDNKL